MFYNWFSTVTVYYGLSLISVSLGGDMYVNFILSGLVEIPSYILTVFLIGTLGRKTILVTCSLLGGLACAGAGLALEEPSLSTGLSLAGKFCVSSCFSILFLYTAEIFPTGSRNSILGLASMMGRLGGLSAPLLAYLGRGEASSTPFFIMGSLGILGGALAIALPETLGAPLPEGLEDTLRLYENPSPLWKFCGCRKKGSFSSSVVEGTPEEGDSSGAPEGLPTIVISAPTPLRQKKTAFESRGSRKRRSLSESEAVDSPESQKTPMQSDPDGDLPSESQETSTQSESEAGFSPGSQETSIQSNLEGVSPPESQQKPPVKGFEAVLPPETQQNPPLSYSEGQQSDSEEAVLSPKDPKTAPPSDSEEAVLSSKDPKTAPPDVPIEGKETEDVLTNASSQKATAGPSLVLPKGASRKFSQLNPAPLDSPDAKRIGSFVMIPTTIPDNSE